MILELNTSNYISALGCHSAFFFFTFFLTIKTFSQKQLLDILRREIFAQADALTNVVGKWPARNSGFRVHSYSIWYLAEDPSAQHGDLQPY